MTKGIEDQLFQNPAIKDKETEVKNAVENSANSTLDDAVKKLKGAQVDKNAAEKKIGEIKTAVSNTDNKDIIPLLDNIKRDIDNPKRNSRIMDSIDNTLVDKDNDTLNNDLDELRKFLGDLDQGAVIIEGLQSVRRFHNDLYSNLSTIDYTTDPRNSVKEKQDAYADNTLARSNAETKVETLNKELKELNEKPKDQILDPNQHEKDKVTKKQQLDEAEKERNKAIIEEAKAKEALDAAELASKNAKSNAQLIVTSRVRSFIEEWLDKRRRTINDYEERIVFLGEVAK